MKLQGFTVIFALVAIPLILVLTYYIQLQVDTITLQTAYDTKLLDATYGALSSFEINTANEDLSSVSDSLRTIIEASNNTFFNTLATNLGMSNASKSYIEPFIPAILYTLYDGYYISTPTFVPEICENSQGQGVYVGDAGVEYDASSDTYIYTAGSPSFVNYDSLRNPTDYGQLLYIKKGTTDEQYTTNISDAKKTRKNVLKTYMPYSARYKKDGEFDITVIYTLDNYITINGTITEKSQDGGTYNDVYYSKSGYLLPSNCIEEFTPPEITLYNQNSAEEYIKNGNPVTVKIDDNTTLTADGAELNFSQNTDIDNASGGQVILRTYKELEDYLIVLNNKLEEKQDQASISDVDQGIILEIQNRINDVQYKLDQMSAVIYYTKAHIFSNWVYNKLNNEYVVLESDLIAVSDESYSLVKGTESVFHEFNTDMHVFDTNGGLLENKGKTEIAVDSPFYTHKLNVIRNSIQYNLNLAMSTYNAETSSTYQYEMPVLQNAEWERILTNVSIVSFMQGYSCGLKTYNNYMVVSSNNNELTVDPQNIYYVPKAQFSNEIAEYHRIDCPELSKIAENPANNEYMSFTSKEVKYDKIYDKSKEHHKYKYDHKNFACYFCINDGNYENVKFDDLNDSLKMAYYLASGKERNNIYKMNAVKDSLGYEVIYDRATGKHLSGASTKPISEIKSIEIVLDKIYSRDSSDNLRFTYYIGNIDETNEVAQNDVSPTNFSVANNQTEITITVNPEKFGNRNVNLKMTDLHIVNQLNESQCNIYFRGDPNREKINGNWDQYNNQIFQQAIKYIRVIYK